jgi:ATP-dependent Lhr-like helicase
MTGGSTASALRLFHPATREWFSAALGQPTPPQELAWPAIARGEHTLLLAPTGSGKTLAAFLWVLDRLWRERFEGQVHAGVQVLYVSPLKALNLDIERNLQAPLAGVNRVAAARGEQWPALRTGVRSGDTPAAARTGMLREPPEILITTPESLYLMLTGDPGRRALAGVRWLILDEIHAVAGSKRGVHLALSVERLQDLVERRGGGLQRIGLSATQRPLDEIARFLGGSGREVTILDAGQRKDTDLQVVLPVEDLSEVPGGTIWGPLAGEIVEQIRSHTSTLVFTNSRRVAERLTVALNDRAGTPSSGPTGRYHVPIGGEAAATADPPLVRTHHGSVAKELRLEVEALLKEGRLPALVATSSLELGIDIGAIDLVIQVESPKGVARGLQRVGRSGHLVSKTSKGRIYPKHRLDLVEAAAIARAMLRGEVEATRVPRNPLDVLAQQIVAAVSVEDWNADELYAVITRAYPYQDLPRRSYEAVLGMLSGRWDLARTAAEGAPANAPSGTGYAARIAWDRIAGRLRARPGARIVALTSGGTIPDRGYYGVYLAGAEVRLGEVDEEFVYETRVGDVFLLGSQTWRVEAMERDRLIVTPAPGEPARMPFWRGEGLGRPYELGQKVTALLRELLERSDDPALSEWLAGEYHLERRAAANLIDLVRDQQAATGAVPHDRQIVVETFKDEIGDHRIAILAPFGGRVNGAWAVALTRVYQEVHALQVETLHNDDGILIRLPGLDQAAPVELIRQVTAANVENLIVDSVLDSALFGALFRQNAQRALLLRVREPGKRAPFWLQRLKAADLLQVVRGIDGFPVVVETYREILQDHFDVPALREILEGVESGRIAVRPVETHAPSPFASGLLFDFIATFMYEWDQPKAERRSHALTMNRELLQELLDEESLRHLLDPRALEEVEGRLQRTAPGYQARSLEEVADLLLGLGDLTPAEVARRAEADREAWLGELATAGRAVRIRVSTGSASEWRWAASEDLPILAPALGLAGSDVLAGGGAGHAQRSAFDALPPELRGRPLAGAEALDLLLRRYARTHAPFQVAELARRYGLDENLVKDRLRLLEGSGAIVSGAYTPGREGLEWVAGDVLAQIHRRTLGILRAQAEPVPPAAFAQFLQAWQGRAALTASRGEGGLRHALAILEGAAIPAEEWERSALPDRVSDYRPELLDTLVARGEVVWTGARSGARGRAWVRLVRRETLDWLATPLGGGQPAPGLEADLHDLLARRGAAFLADLSRQTARPEREVIAGLLELAWKGLVTNDSFAPIRRAKGPPASPPRARAAPPGSLRALRAARARARAEATWGAARWSLVWPLGVEPPPLEERAERWADALLRRYGILSRSLALAEDPPVPWSALYAVLRRREFLGRVRRGYFVAGMEGVQFALPEAVERLRLERDAGSREVTLVRAAEPANPYGAAFPLPDGPMGPVQFARSAGAALVLRGGEPVLLVQASGRALTPLTTAEAALAEACGALDRLARQSPRGRIEVEAWDGEFVLGTPGERFLRGAGFEAGTRGLLLHTRPAGLP